MKSKRIGNSTIKLVQGDITELEIDVIVNAANTQLVMGGGVAGAIRRKGGPEIQEDANTKAPISVGEAVITIGGNLKAKHVIHAVGPRQGEGNEDHKLKNATLNSLKIMDREKLKTIAFPAISTGIFGYPIEKCAKIMISTAEEYLKKDSQIEEVIFCLYTKEDFNVFERHLS